MAAKQLDDTEGPSSSKDSVKSMVSKSNKAESSVRGKIDSLAGGKNPLDPLSVQSSLKTGFLSYINRWRSIYLHFQGHWPVEYYFLYSCYGPILVVR